MPRERSTPPERPGTRRRGRLLLAVAAVLLLAVSGGIAAFILNGDAKPDTHANAGVGPKQDPAPAATPTREAIATPTPTPATEDPEAEAFTELTQIASDDADRVAELEGSWMPQLASSGQADTSASFLARFYEFKQQHPGVVLIRSGDWPGSFGPSSRDSWVIFNGDVVQETTSPVLDWCQSNSEVDSCWARRLERTGDDPTLNTDRFPADERNN